MSKHTKKRRVPRMLKHSSGQARVILSGRTHYLGVYGSPESHARYAELIRRWEAGDRQPLTKALTVPEARFSVSDLFARYRAYLDETGKYTKGGKPTSERTLVGKALAEAENLLGAKPVARITESDLIAYRDRLETNPKLTRGGINRKVGLVKRAFRWGKQRGFVPRDVWLAVQSIEPLRRGEVGDRAEKRKKRIPTLVEVFAILSRCSRQVAAMIRVQLLTGMRPGEVCGMRWQDIEEGVEQGGELFWTYTVAAPKTQHHGNEALYVLDAEVAEEILDEYRRPGGGHLFRVSDRMSERSQQLRARRKTPVTKQTRERDESPKNPYSDAFSTAVYADAISRACKEAGIARFVPHALRHEFISWGANDARVGSGAVGTAVNHSARTTTDRYIHADDRQRFSLAKLAARERLGSTRRVS